MSSELDISEDGYVQVKIGEAVNRVDLYYAHNRLYQITRETEDASAPPTAFLEKVSLLLTDLGFPGCSHRAADKFATWVRDRVEALGKADGHAPTPD